MGKLMIGRLAVVGLLALPLGCQGLAGDSLQNPKASELMAQADEAFGAGVFAQSVELYKLASVAARSEGNEERFAEAAAQVASSYSLMGQGAQGMTWLGEAREAPHTGDPSAHGRVLLASALEARDRGQDGAALIHYQGLFDWSMQHNQWGRALQASTLASVACEPGQRVVWCERGVAAAKASKERSWSAAAHQSLAFAHEEQGDFSKAIGELEIARDLTQSSSRERLRAEWALAHNLRLAGEMGRATGILKRLIPMARSFHSRGFAARDAEWLGRCQEEMAELLAMAGNFTGALRSMNSARQAYQLAEMQDRAPRKWKALEARIAGWKMARRQAQVEAGKSVKEAPTGEAEASDED